MMKYCFFPYPIRIELILPGNSNEENNFGQNRPVSPVTVKIENNIVVNYFTTPFYFQVKLYINTITLLHYVRLNGC